MWRFPITELGSSVCLDYGNKILNQKMLSGEEGKELLASLLIISECVLLNSSFTPCMFFISISGTVKYLQVFQFLR